MWPVSGADDDVELTPVVVAVVVTAVVVVTVVVLVGVVVDVLVGFTVINTVNTILSKIFDTTKKFMQVTSLRL